MTAAWRLWSLLAGLLVGAIVAIATVGGDQEAAAHGFEIYFSDRGWSVDPSRRLGSLQASLDGTSADLADTEADFAAADTQWSGVVGSTFDVAGYDGYHSSVVWTGSGCTTATWGNITVVSYNISAIASESTCGTSTQITRSAIRLDFRSWANGGGSVASHEYDLRGVLVHEIGHSAGYGDGSATDHFTDSATCPNSSARNSMCPNVPTGKTWFRTLESHDEHTIADFY